LRQKSKISAGWRMVTFKDGEMQRRPLVASSDVRMKSRFLGTRKGFAAPRRPDLTAEAAASIGIRAQAPYRQLPEVAAPQGTDDQPAWGFGAIVSGVRG